MRPFPTPQDTANRLEDLRWMAETGECLSGAARRLGLPHETLRSFLMRRDRELLRVLTDRDPRDPNSTGALSAAVRRGVLV